MHTVIWFLSIQLLVHFCIKKYFVLKSGKFSIFDFDPDSTIILDLNLDPAKILDPSGSEFATLRIRIRLYVVCTYKHYIQTHISSVLGDWRATSTVWNTQFQIPG
jgi:hypothetical protein